MDFNRFDVSMKELVWDDPAACLERWGIGPRGPVEVIDSDITALTAAADKVLKVGGRDPYLVNIEFQSSHKTNLKPHPLVPPGGPGLSTRPAGAHGPGVAPKRGQLAGFDWPI